MNMNNEIKLEQPIDCHGIDSLLRNKQSVSSLYTK